MTQQGTLKMRDMKLRDTKKRHHVAGVENARHENAAPDCKGGKCETWKCEKRDSMEHRLLHMSVHCRAGMHESTRKRKLCCQLCCQLRCTDYIFIIRFYSSYICHLKYLKTTTGRTLRRHLKIDFDTDLASNITRHSCAISTELVVSSFINNWN